MSDYDDSSPLLEWLRQPRWIEGSEQKRLFEAADEIEQLRKGIQDYLDGNYLHSRSYRPDACPHGLLWFNGDCDQCAEEHFKALLAGSLRNTPYVKPK